MPRSRESEEEALEDGGRGKEMVENKVYRK